MKSRQWLASPGNLTAEGIHSDAAARDLGFAGGFVAGVGLYGHIVDELLDQGEDWYSHGSVEFSFRKPVYDNEKVSFSIDGSDGTFTVSSPDGQERRAFGTLGIQVAAPSLSLGVFQVPAPQPLGLPDQVGVPLQLEVPTDPEKAATVVEATGEPLRRIGERPVYPLAMWLNPVDLLKAYFESPFTIHYWGRVWHHSPLFLGETIVKRGLITGFEEGRGKKIVAYSVSVSTTDGRPLVTIEHKSVYELDRAPATAK